MGLLIFVAALAADSAVLPILQASYAAAPAEASASEPDQDPVSKYISAYHEGMYANDFRKALAAARRLEPGPSNRTGTAIVAVMRASALLGLKQDKEAQKLIAQAEKLAPQEPDVLSTLFLGSVLADRSDVAADAFDRMIARAPDKVRDLDLELVWHFLRNEPKDNTTRNEDRKVALARIGYGGGTSAGDYMAEDAVDILVKRSDFAGAADLIRYIDEPQIIENLLLQRRYERLWPTVEAQAGPQLEKVRASSVRSAERAVAEAPDDREALHNLARALRNAGRLDEVIALRSKLPATREAMAIADEDLGWFVNEVALALHAAGRTAEADQLYALLNEASIKDDRWIVSMKINRLELLVADGKFHQALPLVEPTAQAEGTPYAQQLVRRLRYCTLSGLGRTADATKLLPDLLAHAKDAPGPTIDGLICAGQLDEAEKLVLASLEEDRFHSDFVRALQAKPLSSDDPSVWQQGWKQLRGRPAIAAEFNRLGRDMPAPFLPPASTGRSAAAE